MANKPLNKSLIKHFTFSPDWILYEDDDIILANKPSGLLSVPGRGAEKSESLFTHLSQQKGDVFMVHRLDMDTSGLMVVAKHKAAHRHLSIQFQDRLTDKTYHAIGFGYPNVDRGIIHLPMRCDWENRPLQMVDPVHGKHASTQWKIEKRYQFQHDIHAFLTKLTPITGRSHQLRLHMKMLGHPILGDNLYADNFSLSASQRLLLHATELSFKHPVSQEILHFSCPVDLSQFITLTLN